MRKYSRFIITVSLFVLAAFSLVFFEIRQTKILSDGAANELLGNVISRVSICALFIWIMHLNGNLGFLRVRRSLWRRALWTIPCFLVAVVNFPFSALISGELVMVRADLIGLYIVYIVAIALLEEFVFRGIVVALVFNYFRRGRRPYIMTTVVASAFFSLIHLTNLFSGAMFGSVLLQLIYSFLLGAMLTVVIFKTRNIWLCVLIHAIFNFGGLLTVFIARGNPWDLVFWVLTAVFGILCAIHVIATLNKLEKEHVS
ncbi:MAG: CPBP family intramembrane metalloprotease [Erysipelotrichia bacterium]|nr:CPBP family intramembrane metalloprotease [Erysipelotrichia bacterium]